ncbi:MAG: DUF4142 domain-containing protein [Flavitalea sp.]
MKRISTLLITGILLCLITFDTLSSEAQAIAPEKSAKAAAASDTRLINANIRHYQDIMFFSQKALDRGGDEKIKELATQMLEDNSAMLYAMEQLASAGSGSSNHNAAGANDTHEQAALLNGKLAALSGENFDTLWVSSLLTLQQTKYDELTLAKETVTNPQLKTSITEAVLIIRKELSQLVRLQKDIAKIALQKKKLAAKQKKQG